MSNVRGILLAGDTGIEGHSSVFPICVSNLELSYTEAEGGKMPVSHRAMAIRILSYALMPRRGVAALSADQAGSAHEDTTSDYPSVHMEDEEVW